MRSHDSQFNIGANMIIKSRISKATYVAVLTMSAGQFVMSYMNIVIILNQPRKESLYFSLKTKKEQK